MLVETVLSKKGGDVHSVAPNASVYHALEIMDQQNIGALLVIAKEEIVGIFTERDYARKVVLKGRVSHDIPVGEVMTKDVCFVDKKKSLSECMAVMTGKRVRHLPVLEDNQLVGVVSIGDVVKHIIDEQEHEIENLIGYIHGIY